MNAMTFVRPTLAWALLLVACLAGLPARADEPGVVILAPIAEETIHDNNGEMVVAVDLAGGATLGPEQRLRVLVDGAPYGPDGREFRFVLKGVPRGEHLVQAVLLDSGGGVVSASPPVKFYMWQASALFPTRKH